MKVETLFKILKRHYKSHSAVARKLGYSVHHYADIRAGRKRLTPRARLTLELLVEQIANNSV